MSKEKFLRVMMYLERLLQGHVQEKPKSEFLECDVILVPNIARKWIHFDYQIYINGEYYGTKVSSSHSGWGVIRKFSFEKEDIKKYIYSEDKKSLRKKTLGNLTRGESNIDIAFYDQEIHPDFISDDDGFMYLYDHFLEKKAYVKSVKVIPVYICPRCARAFDHPIYLSNGSNLSNRCLTSNIFLYKLCGCSKRSQASLVFWNGRVEISDENYNRIELKDPRRFLYEKNQFKKGFYKKYVVRHLNRIKKLRPVSKRELTFFRSWLGARDLSLLAN